MIETEIEMRAKAFQGETVRVHRIAVAFNGEVRVWDEIAGHFTLCHCLGKSALKRARALAGIGPIQVLGERVWYDASGVGHCWRLASPIDCPADIQEELAAAMLEGEKAPYTASNGVRYRWSPRPGFRMRDRKPDVRFV